MPQLAHGSYSGWRFLTLKQYFPTLSDLQERACVLVMLQLYLSVSARPKRCCRVFHPNHHRHLSSQSAPSIENASVAWVED